MNDKKFTIREITNAILILEEKFNLLEWKINNVFVWQSARVLIFTKICELLNLQPSLSKKQNLIDNLKFLYQRVIINSILYNPFFDFTKTNSLVFESGRKYLRKDRYIDIYTEYLCEELKNNNVTYTKYECSYKVDALNKNKNNIKHLDFILISSQLLSKFIRIRINCEEINKIKDIENNLREVFGIEINLFEVFVQEIKRFKSQYPFYKALFKLKRSQKIFLINSCEKAPLIKAAKDSNMIVTELQHGLMAKEDLIGHFPNTPEDSLEYFPHIFYIWEDLNMFTSKLPISKTNIRYFANKHLKYIKNNTQNITRKGNQILIVSQPELTKEILQFVLNNLNEMDSFKFVYKMHPMEELNFYNNKDTQRLMSFNNVTVAGNNNSIYELFIESKYVIGVYSAAVFEASYFGCKTLLLDLPGVEMTNSLVESGKANLINLNARLILFIDM